MRQISHIVIRPGRTLGDPPVDIPVPQDFATVPSKHYPQASGTRPREGLRALPRKAMEGIIFDHDAFKSRFAAWLCFSAN
jgi:hypothetical protein